MVANIEDKRVFNYAVWGNSTVAAWAAKYRFGNFVFILAAL
jgi:hypothetical protein